MASNVQHMRSKHGFERLSRKKNKQRTPRWLLTTWHNCVGLKKRWNSCTVSNVIVASKRVRWIVKKQSYHLLSRNSCGSGNVGVYLTLNVLYPGVQTPSQLLTVHFIFWHHVHEVVVLAWITCVWCVQHVQPILETVIPLPSMMTSSGLELHTPHGNMWKDGLGRSWNGEASWCFLCHLFKAK